MTIRHFKHCTLLCLAVPLLWCCQYLTLIVVKLRALEPDCFNQPISLIQAA